MNWGSTTSLYTETSLYALQLINFILACVATSMNFTLTPNVTYSAHT